MLSKIPVECPRHLLEMASEYPPVTAAVVGSHSLSTLESIKLALTHQLINPILIGHRDATFKLAASIGLDPEPFPFIDAQTDSEAALEGAVLAREGEVGMVIKGQIHSEDLMYPLVSRTTGIRTGRRLTHLFHMTLPGSDRALMISDGALNVAPDLKTRQEIIINAVDLARAIGISSPKVALLAATESSSETMPVTIDAAELAEWANQNIDDITAAGPLAFDNIVSCEAAKIKGIESPVAGSADIVVVPTIETGNALSKMMVYFMSACAAGIVLGGKVPVVLTSRADPAPARLASIAIATLLANNQANE